MGHAVNRTNVLHLAVGVPHRTAPKGGEPANARNGRKSAFDYGGPVSLLQKFQTHGVDSQIATPNGLPNQPLFSRENAMKNRRIAIRVLLAAVSCSLGLMSVHAAN